MPTIDPYANATGGFYTPGPLTPEDQETLRRFADAYARCTGKTVAERGPGDFVITDEPPPATLFGLPVVYVDKFSTQDATEPQ